MPHRIVILFEYPTLNGGERSMLQVLDHVDPSEFEPVAIAPPAGRLADELRRRRYRHVPLTMFDAAGARLPRDQVQAQLSTTLRSVSPALVHANSLAMGRFTGAVACPRFLCVSHLRDIMKLSRAAVADLNANRALIAVSEATRRFHVAQGVDAAQIRVIRNGVDCGRFRPRPSAGRLHAELKLDASSLVLLTVGQIGLRKGQDVLAEAAPLVTARLSQAHFVLLGQRDSGKQESMEFEAMLHARFGAHGLADRLHCLGYRDNVESLMNDADLLVHPAKQEPLGRVLLEAAAAGLPIVATSVGGTSEILTDRVSARLVAPGAPVELAEAIVELAQDKPQRQRLAEAARCRVLSAFRAETAAAQLCAVWKQLLQ